MALKAGQRISNIFGPNDPPPWYDLNAQRFPRARNADEILQETNRREKARQKFLEKKQLEDPLAVLTPKEEEQFQTSDPRKYPKIPGLCFFFSHALFFTRCMFVAGFVGSAKGGKQMLWERGHWRSGLTLACVRKILKEMSDFKLETSELCNLWRGRGHGFELGVKCHPEMAGCGIEYCWGKVRLPLLACRRACLLCVRVQGKYEFRNFVNTKTTKRERHTANVLTSLGDQPYEARYTKRERPAPLPLFRVRRYVHACLNPRAHTHAHTHRFDRKCRDFKRAYSKFETPRALHRAAQDKKSSDYKFIKETIKRIKSHRCTGALQTRVCVDEDSPNSQFQLLQI